MNSYFFSGGFWISINLIFRIDHQTVKGSRPLVKLKGRKAKRVTSSFVNKIESTYYFFLMTFEDVTLTTPNFSIV
jgi:hypothetical protein